MKVVYHVLNGDYVLKNNESFNHEEHEGDEVLSLFRQAKALQFVTFCLFMLFISFMVNKSTSMKFLLLAHQLPTLNFE